MWDSLITKGRELEATPDLPVISLYTGAGGLDLGLEAVGFRIAVAVEMDRHACETLRHNHPNLPILEGRIDEFSTAEILRAAVLKKREAKLVVGGPPCQPFSKAGYWTKGDTKRLDDPRADTLTSFMRVVRDAQPEAFLLENVRGLEYTGKNEGLKYLFKLLETINRECGTDYTINWKVLNAAEHGVPQLRERGFLIGVRNGNHFSFPQPTFRARDKSSSLFEALPRCRTAWDGIGDLSDPRMAEDLAVRGRWCDLLPSIPEGENYLWHTDRKGGSPLFGWRTKYWSFLLKLAKDRPSWTIAAQPGPSIGPFHWMNRLLSTREMARLQTFPDGYQIRGSRVEVQRQLGNAVPSLLTEVLGRALRRQCFDGFDDEIPLSLLPPDRSPYPPPEPIEEVPDKFLHLMGDHAPHPGTGRGPAARRRDETSVTS